ncbi:MAG: FAD-binding oxidoreductase [Flavobacteriaceae bacterium]|nr:FAD-binding oxidoreductase [Flavobacteriaceae bacterium]
MEKLDYIIVGLGIAGVTFCEQLEAAGKSFIVIDAEESNATSVAGGVVNPVVLKRITPVWKAGEFMDVALPFYKKLSSKLNANFFSETAIQRIFYSAKEQNDWMIACDSKALSPFLSAEISKNENEAVKAPFGLGSVKQCFQINTGELLTRYRTHLKDSDRLVVSEFDYAEIEKFEDHFQYKNHSAKHLVFSEGSRIIQNPHFSIEAIIPKKGEYIIFESEELQLKTILKGSYFIIPLGENKYKAGATFAHGDTSLNITDKGRDQLIEGVRKMIQCDMNVVDQVSGMRPTVKDRRPILGSLLSDSMYFFNGLGTRGLLMAPLLSNWLFRHIEEGLELPSEVNIRRFQLKCYLVSTFSRS